ncbi:hypothetical protein MMC32_008025 [Xylographa parallela]|nr:hypothetical protein [Xylographa parallela]
MASEEHHPLLTQQGRAERNVAGTRLDAFQITKLAYREEGVGVFFRGLGVCSMRAFIVNAVQWAVYEWTMRAMRTV